MPGTGTVNGWAVAAASAGAALAYSGLRGHRITNTMRAFLTGNNPANTPQTTAINTPVVTSISSGVVAGSDAATPGQLANVSGRRQIVVSAALSQLNKPYVWDTPLDFSNPNPTSFDCSGLIGWCYEKVGVRLAHYTGTQFTQVPHAPLAERQPGDLIFWADVTIHHVALYIGNNQVVEAPDVGIPVRVRTIRPGESGMISTVGVLPGG